MTEETTKPEEDIDAEAIARWNNEGGAPRPIAVELVSSMNAALRWRGTTA